ncbi:hypothetical protein LTR22_019356 [Elasticomyces elasticus]|nr:hypothetical protein LTR22_019356 [Elasticomyces elasticus]KAK5769301.1 hypothetical protein LTS12_000653 [Elasticomyces elasticus]
MHLNQGNGRSGLYSRRKGTIDQSNPIANQILTDAQSPKASRNRPQPLSFEHSKSYDVDHKHRRSESVALHDATVRSATNLMAVVNDMLQSPQVAAHLSAQQERNLTPMYGRPRSHTAPCTPLVEAPCAEPAELPGSLVAGQKSMASLRQVADGLYAPVQPSPRSKSSGPHCLSQTEHDDMPAFAIRADERVNNAVLESARKSVERPSLNILQSWPYKTSCAGSTAPNSRAGSLIAYPTADTGLTQQLTQEAGAEHDLLEQIVRMRTSHESHLASLREAHERELDSHRSYTAFLEQRRGLIQATHEPVRRRLTLDTAHAAPRGGEQRSADASATTHQSFDSLESQKRVSQEASAEAEALKRKLSLAKKAQTEFGDVRRERDRLRQEADSSSRRITQLKEIVRKSKAQEKSHINTISDLEARLLAANNERTDVLEGLLEASAEIQKLKAEESTTVRAMEELRNRLFFAEGRHATMRMSDAGLARGTNQPKHTRTKSEYANTISNSTAQHIDELMCILAAREARIQQLEQDIGNTAIQDRMSELEASLYDHKNMLLAAREDRERYNSLLHHELRRQSRVAAQTPLSGIHPLVQLTKDDNPSTGRQNLERELQHCLEEIILYKLDIRGYKKDLKRAEAELAERRYTNAERPPTPHSESSSSIRSDASDIQNHSGLGILLPQTPTRTLASATSAALLAATPAMPASPPPPRPNTPMSTHKKLPKPPASRTPSPLPYARLQRDGTPRSLSDSIISSYAQRNT